MSTSDFMHIKYCYADSNHRTSFAKMINDEECMYFRYQRFYCVRQSLKRCNVGFAHTLCVIFAKTTFTDYLIRHIKSCLETPMQSAYTSMRKDNEQSLSRACKIMFCIVIVLFVICGFGGLIAHIVMK